MGTELRTEAREAAEAAIEALGRRDPAGARMAVAVHVAPDQVPRFARLADAVYLAAAQLEADQEIDEATWNQLADAVGAGVLLALVEQARG